MVSLLDLLEAALAAVGVALLVIYYLERKNAKRYQDLMNASVASARQGRSSDDAEDNADDDSPKIAIIFCSQSGTGQDFAEGFADEAAAYGYKATVFDIEEYDFAKKLGSEELVIWYVATHGEGDPSDSALGFDEWIMDAERDQETLLQSRFFSVFALGNRQYEFFNATGIKFDKRFEALQGNRLLEIGLGDDDGSIEEDHEAWKLAVWPRIHAHFQMMPDESLAHTVPLTAPSFRIVYAGNATGDDEEESLAERFSRVGHVHMKNAMATVVDSYELRKEPTETLSTRHVVLDLSDTSLSYKTAANLAVRPINPPKVVAQLCKRLEVEDPDRLFTLKALRPDERKKSPLPSPCSARDAFRCFVDICSVPRKRFLGFLSQYTTDEKEKAVLAKMALLDGKDLYHQHYIEEKRSVLETLLMFPSCQPPLEHFIEECPALQPRYFTIASSNLKHPSQVHLTVALVHEELWQGRVHRGVCSSYLCSLRCHRVSAPPQVCVSVRDSSFVLPVHASTPVIMVGPGTGIAPFRAFLQEAHFRLQRHGVKVSNWHLFFGCRHEAADYLYREELEEALSLGLLSKLHLAFSRDQPQKVYVQDRLRDAKADLLPLILHQGAHVYVCGATDMGRSVREAFKSILASAGKTDDEAAAYVSGMVEQGRYVAELWG